MNLFILLSPSYLLHHSDLRQLKKNFLHLSYINFPWNRKQLAVFFSQILIKISFSIFEYSSPVWKKYIHIPFHSLVMFRIYVFWHLICIESETSLSYWMRVIIFFVKKFHEEKELEKLSRVFSVQKIVCRILKIHFCVCFYMFFGVFNQSKKVIKK